MIIEYVFSLVFLFFFLIVFFEFTGVILRHERLSYAAFVGGRVYQVNKNKFQQAATSVAGDFARYSGAGPDTGYTILIKDKLGQALAYDNFFGSGAKSHIYQASQKFYDYSARGSSTTDN